jgi:predicted DNA-binding protein YlxM (UPF0122 family)
MAWTEAEARARMARMVRMARTKIEQGVGVQAYAADAGGEDGGGRPGMAMLLDFYGSLLTERQAEVLDMYYNEDFSLAEVGESLSVSRQAAHDIVRRASAQLAGFESKLGLARAHAENARRAERVLAAAAELGALIGAQAAGGQGTGRKGTGAQAAGGQGAGGQGSSAGEGRPEAGGAGEWAERARRLLGEIRQEAQAFLKG